MIYLKITEDLVCGWSGGAYYLGLADDHEIFEQPGTMPSYYPEDDDVWIIDEPLAPKEVFKKLVKALQTGGIPKAELVLAKIQNGSLAMPKSALAAIGQIAPQASWYF